MTRAEGEVNSGANHRPLFISSQDPRFAEPAGRPAVPPGPYLVLGLGRAGRAATRALSDRFGADSVHTWDDGPRAHSGRWVEATPDPGDSRRDAVRTIIKSPGIPFAHPLLQSARRSGVTVLDEFELGWRLSDRPLVGVTGTNGKSTTSSLIAAVLDAHGMTPALVGNVDAGQGVPFSALPAGDGWVVAEVSSYQASGLDALWPQVSVLTNLTPDHLHWHGSMEAYADAKRRLFVKGKRAVALAVVNRDDAFGRRLAGEVSDRGGRVLTYGREVGADVRITACRWDAHRSRTTFQTPGGPVTLATRFPGEHNAANLAAVLALAHGLGLGPEPTATALSGASPLPGRMETVAAGQPYDVIVDFAHSPDSLRRTLATMRAVAVDRGGRLIAMIGIAPSGQRATRISCGRVARVSCDLLILSGWSHKGEPPLVALAGVLAGAREVPGAELEVILDRRLAIARALSVARTGDLVGILGRGALSSARLDGHSPPVRFDDRAVVRELLARAGGNAEFDH